MSAASLYRKATPAFPPNPFPLPPPRPRGPLHGPGCGPAMDGPQDPLEAFQDAYQVFTWRSPTGVKDLVRDTLRRSTAQRVTPAGPDVIESMMYKCRVAEMMNFILTSDTMQELCERLQAERDHVAGVYADAQEVERLRLEASAAAAAPPRPSAAYPPLAPEPQGPWPPPAGVAGPSQPPPAYRRAHLSPGPRAEEHPLLLSRPLEGRQRRVTLHRPRPRQLGARLPPRPLRGSCLEDRPTRCTTSGPRRGSRPGSRWLRAARWGGKWRGAGQRPSVRAPTRTSS